MLEEEWILIQKRLEAWSEKIGIASFGLGNFTKDEMLKHVQDKDDIGKKFSEVQLYYLKSLKERAK